MLSDGPPPIRLDLTGAASAPALRAGQRMETVVQGTANEPMLRLAGLRIPLEPGPATLPGQALGVHVLQTTPQLELQLTPLAASNTPGLSPTPPLETLLAPILRVLDGAGQSALAERLLPEQLPQNPQALRQLLGLFFQRNQLMGDLQELGLLLQQATGENVLSPAAARQFNAFAARFAAQESGEFQKLIEQTARGQRAEARLLQALAAGKLENVLQSLRATLRSQVARLAGNKALLAYLKGTRQLRKFENLAQRVLDRLAGGELQNLRNLEQPYHFLELPLGPDAPLRQAQLHFFSDGKRRPGEKIDQEKATVVLDLDTSKLGPLWISLKFTPSHCACQIRAVSEKVRVALQEAREELAGALGDSGYAKSTLEVFPWDGNRIRAAAALMNRFRGISLNI